MNVKCPYCKRTLVNRLVDHCLYCERVLPEKLRLSDEDKRRLRLAALRELEEKRQTRRKRDAEEMDAMVRDRWLMDND